ncbi:MAG: cytochrome b/b6 domain-containing protein [Terricaulis sp.]
MHTWNSKQAFGWVSVTLHWVAALGVLAMIYTGLQGGWAEDAGNRDLHRAYMGLHVSIGGTLLIFALARVFAHYAQTQPNLPSGEAKTLQGVARITHHLLLLAIVIQFISGPLLVWSGVHPINIFNIIALPSPFAERNRDAHEIADTLHLIGRWTLIVIIPVHVAAALKHEFVDRDGVLMQMLAPGRPLLKP